jgi:hypothetical protein
LFIESGIEVSIQLLSTDHINSGLGYIYVEGIMYNRDEKEMMLGLPINYIKIHGFNRIEPICEDLDNPVLGYVF